MPDVSTGIGSIPSPVCDRATISTGSVFSAAAIAGTSRANHMPCSASGAGVKPSTSSGQCRLPITSARDSFARQAARRLGQKAAVHQHTPPGFGFQHRRSPDSLPRSALRLTSTSNVLPRKLARHRDRQIALSCHRVGVGRQGNRGRGDFAHQSRPERSLSTPAAATARCPSDTRIATPIRPNSKGTIIRRIIRPIPSGQ